MLPILLKKKRQENIGIILILSSALLWGLYPVLVNVGVQSLPPIFFSATTVLMAAVFSFLYILFSNQKFKIQQKKVRIPLIMITLFVIIVPSILFFTGAKLTSGINTSFLMLSELIFAMIFTHFMGEKTTWIKVLGGCGVLIGAGFLLYNGSFQLNWGDVLIFLSGSTYVFGNFYGKKALHLLPPEVILFVRSFLGGLFLLIVSLIIETPFNLLSLVQENWILLVINGFFMAFLSKIFWYQGLKRLDIFKATSIVMIFPLFSLIFLITFFGESINVQQWAGIIIMMMGVYFSVKRPSTDSGKTRYAEELMNPNT